MSEVEAPKRVDTPYLKLDKFFKTPPATLPAKDGSKRKIILEHRLGSDNGAYTLSNLLQRTGLLKELTDRAIVMEKKIPDAKLSNQFFNALQAKYFMRLRMWVKSYRSYLTRYYLGQKIRPIMNFVPTPNDKKPVLFIQGFVDIETSVPLLGDLDDITLAIEAKNSNLKKMMDEYKSNQIIAKKMMSLPNINKDLEHRLNLVATGQLERIEFKDRVTGAMLGS